MKEISDASYETSIRVSLFCVLEKHKAVKMGTKIKMSSQCHLLEKLPTFLVE